MEKVSGTLNNVPAIATYGSLKDRPQINDVELLGNKTADDLGLASKEQVEKVQKQTEELQKTIDNLIDGNEVEY